MKTLFGLLRGCEDGAIVISEDVRRLAGDASERPALDAARGAGASVPRVDGARSQASSHVATRA